MKQKEYKFNLLSGEGVTEYTKLESELSTQEKDLLLGRLITDWESYPSEVQINFMHRLFHQTKSSIEGYLEKEGLKEEFRERAKKTFDDLLIFGEAEVRFGETLKKLDDEQSPEQGPAEGI